MVENLILVDKNDKEIGIEEKIKAHRIGKLYRAFSIFIFNSKNQFLLQKRAKSKYHSGGLWTNTCCSHPKPNESLKKAVHRRLKEEIGFDYKLKEIFSFVYKVKIKVKIENNLYEHEYDHVFFGKYNGKPKINPKETDTYEWIDIKELKRDIQKKS